MIGRARDVAGVNRAGEKSHAREDSGESKFISVGLKEDFDEFRNSVKGPKRKDQSVLTMLLDQFYKQNLKHSKPNDTIKIGEDTPLFCFLKRFGLSSFYT